MQEHIVKSYDEEINDLNDRLDELAEACRMQLIAASQAFETFDLALAEQIVKKDQLINEMQRDIENLCVKLLALRSPMAADLRYFISVMKISSELERIADYCANIAKRVSQLSEKPTEKVDLIIGMVQMCIWMLQNAMTAFKEQNAKMAVKVWGKDGKVDKSFAQIMDHFHQYPEKSEESFSDATQILFIARCCERIGDHITNIAEDICFFTTGPDYMDLFEGSSESE